MIEAPVGCGKTHFALKVLPKYAIGNDFMLYITDTNMNREQILATYDNACGYDKDWRRFINSQPKNRIGNGWGDWGNVIKPDSQITIMNYAQVAALIFFGHPFNWNQFDYIVCDELHNLIYYSHIKPKYGTESILDLTIQKIKATLQRCPNVKIVGITATPTEVYKKFPKTDNVLIRQNINKNDLKQYEVFQFRCYSDYVKILRAIPVGCKGIIYFDHIHTIQEAESILIKRGHRTGSFWSMSNEKKMTQSQIDVRQYIIDNQMIPPEVDILLINAACQTGVNIKNDDITFMLIHAPMGSDTLIQARGRLRNDLNNLYYYDKTYVDTPNPVPAEFLNRKITVSEMKEVCNEVRYMKPHGKGCYSTEKVIEYLNQHGYHVEKTRIGHGGANRGYIIELV